MNKSTLFAYTQTSQNVLTNGDINFSNAYNTGCSIRFVPGSTQVNIKTPGLYYVTFNGYGAESETAGNITVQMSRNGVLVPGAIASANSSAVTGLESLSFSTIVRVSPSCSCVDNNTTLTFVNTGVNTTFANTAITIVRVA
jgi:hypothetical protein|nr:MAG TPA: BclA protein [Caudoviricetes sp.]